MTRRTASVARTHGRTRTHTGTHVHVSRRRDATDPRWGGGSGGGGGLLCAVRLVPVQGPEGEGKKKTLLSPVSPVSRPSPPRHPRSRSTYVTIHVPPLK